MSEVPPDGLVWSSGFFVAYMRHNRTRTWKLVPGSLDPEVDGLSGMAKPKFPNRWKPRPVENACIDLEDNAVKRIAAATLLKAVEDYRAICNGKTIPDTELCELVQFLVSPYAAALFCAAGIDRGSALLQLAEMQVPPNAILMAAISLPRPGLSRPIPSRYAGVGGPGQVPLSDR